MIRAPRLASTLTALAFAFLATSTRAEICVYVDEDGHVTYSNIASSPPKGARKVRCFEDRRPQAAPAAPAAPRPASPQQEFPRVDADTQRSRDAERQRILEAELASEQQRLEAARRTLEQQESVRHGHEQNYQRYLDRVQPHRDAVANHERNIEAIRQEISNLR
jgi:hypothetical protein